MAYALGFAGGYADEVDVEPPIPGLGGPLWVPTRAEPRPVRRQGRATLRLKVAFLAWGSEGAQRSRRTIAAACRASGGGATRSRTGISGDVRARYGHAAMSTRASILAHVGDPREDDQVILLAVAALLSSSSPARAPEHHGSTR
jgi:hypothetical protein